MININVIREEFSKHYQHVQDLGGGVLRGERLYENRPYSVAYVDLSDSVVERSQHLTDFQERIVGPNFFEPDTDLRWNSYFYFIAGPRSISNQGFNEAKTQIESDRHFARKFVLDPAGLIARLREPVADPVARSSQLADASEVWAELLREASLGFLIEQPSRRSALEEISGGKAFAAEPARRTPGKALKADPLASGFLRKLEIGSFRKVCQGKSFTFGDVNLIVGANGAGKTSLLEAIESLYCGRVRRDPEAQFSNIVATVETEEGALKSVDLPKTVAVLKARNTLWYGRADFQSHAISQGFSRFNFLDSDAAYRLSNDAAPEDIKGDLNSLLVGPEASKFWDYLVKVSEELGTRLRNVSERLPEQQKTVDLLQTEVQRLRGSPSEATTLLSAYRASLSTLAPTWKRETLASQLDVAERDQVSRLLEAARLIQSAFPESPITRESMEGRVLRLREAVSEAKGMRARSEALARQRGEARERLSSIDLGTVRLEAWLKLLRAQIPALATKINEVESKELRLQRQLVDQTSASPPVIQREYAELTVADAQGVAHKRLQSAERQLKAAEAALSQSIERGESLSALLRDLHDASLAYLERTGDTGSCPVCGTRHVPDDLQRKISELAGTQGETATESLRQTLNVAREHAAKCRNDVATVTALEKYAEKSGAIGASTCGSLSNALERASSDLSATKLELQQLRERFRQASIFGNEPERWEEGRDEEVVPLLGAGSDPNSEDVIASAIRMLREQASAETATERQLHDAVKSLAKDLSDLSLKELGGEAHSLDGGAQVSALERAQLSAERAIQEFDGHLTLLGSSSAMSVEVLQQHLEACLLAFDRAQRALSSQAEEETALQRKSADLSDATEKFVALTNARDNLARAKHALSQLVDRHSLEQATKKAFDEIKERVGEVFLQIHSPQEYRLGGFDDDELVLTRDNGQSHAVNQVSTGQRAALALSIFLALNDSAKSAPPILLIDDPVAHIDDLNALSFLDYLRETVLRGRKQIFFATADIRLAALFQKKFEFLGKERFRRIAVSRNVAGF